MELNLVFPYYKNIWYYLKIFNNKLHKKMYMKPFEKLFNKQIKIKYRRKINITHNHCKK